MSATVLAAPSRQLLEQLRAWGRQTDRAGVGARAGHRLAPLCTRRFHRPQQTRRFAPTALRQPTLLFPKSAPRWRIPEDRYTASIGIPFHRFLGHMSGSSRFWTGGLGVLKNHELGELMLNPYALADLHDVISELAPETWLPTIHEVCRQMTQLEGVSSTKTSPQTRLLPEECILATSTPGRVSAWGWAALSLLGLATVLLIGFLGVLLGRALYGR